MSLFPGEGGGLLLEVLLKMKLHLKQDESDNTNISNTNYSVPAEVFNISIIIIMKGHTR